MKCKKSNLELIDYLFGEMSEMERKAFLSHLEQCDNCQNASKILRETQTLLLAGQEETAPEINLSVPSLAHSRPAPKLQRLRSPILGFAVGAFATFLLFSMLNFRLTFSENNVTLEVSTANKNRTTTQEQTYITVDDLSAWREQTLYQVNKLILESESRKRQESQLMLSGLAKGFQEQRRLDLHLVGEGLENFQNSNLQEIQRTRMALNQIMQINASEHYDNSYNKQK